MAMLTRREEIVWVAGLLEGEGHFAPSRGCPRIKLVMTDRDIVERAACVLGATASIKQYKPTSPSGGETKLAYRLTIDGRRAAAWMMMLWPFLGVRRRERITAVLGDWRSRVACIPKTVATVPCSQCGAVTGRAYRGGPRLCRACRREWRKPYTARALASRKARLPHYSAEWSKAARVAAKAAGRCTMCASAAVAGRAMCERHLAWKRTYQNAWNAKRKAAHTV